MPFSFMHEQHSMGQVSEILEYFNDGRFNILLCSTAGLDVVPDYSFHRIVVVHEDANEVDDPRVEEHRFRKFSRKLGPLPAGVNTTTIHIRPF